MKLGRLAPHPPEHAHHSVKLARYLAPSLTAPPSVDWSQGVAFDAYGNLSVGDCAVAAPANLVRAWTKNVRNIAMDAVLEAYTVVSGYDPAQPLSDTGAIISDVLALWSTTGAGGIGGDVLAGFAEVAHDSPYHMQLAVALFGGCVIGVALPKSAHGASEWTSPAALTGDNAPGSWGGHCVCVVGYSPEGVTVVTWGGLMHASWGWIAAYCDEAWACVSADWQPRAGVDLGALMADMRTIADRS